LIFIKTESLNIEERERLNMKLNQKDSKLNFINNSMLITINTRNNDT
jgi:hypothetical protein